MSDIRHDCLRRLLALPFVDGAHDQGRLVEIESGGKRFPYRPVEVRSHLSRELLRSVVDRARLEPGRPLILAPWLSRPAGAILREEGLQYIDTAGNCHLAPAAGLLAMVEGRPRLLRPPAARGVRGPGHRVLFALLADRTLPPGQREGLISASLRTIAARAGASRQAVTDMLVRMDAAGWTVGRGKQRRWLDQRLVEAAERWVAGYLDTLRPELLLGSWRLKADQLPEAAVYRTFEGTPWMDEWRWGGRFVAGVLTGYYEGQTRYVLHVEDLPATFEADLEALPDPAGNLVVVRPPGPMAMRKPAGAGGERLAHPLLVYAETLLEGSERAREVGRMVLRFCDGLGAGP